MEITGATALVTGASGGLGQAIARALAARGAKVIVSARREDILAGLAAELGNGATAIAVDLADSDDVDRLAGEAAGVDILAANAGLPGAGRLDDFTAAQLDRAIDVNLRAPMQLARALHPAMVARGRGHVVFIGSMNSKIPTPRTSVYAATKFGLRGFALSLRDDLHGTGVGVSSVYPGFVRDAGMWADTKLDPPRGIRTNTAAEVAEAVVRAITRNRAEVEVAPAAVRLASRLSLIWPGAMAALSRRGGSHAIAERIGEAQAPKR